MASNQLTAKVKIETTQAERALERLNNKINSINKAVNSANRGGSNSDVQKVNRINKILSMVNQKIRSVIGGSSRLSSAWSKAETITGRISTKLTQWRSKLSGATSMAKQFTSALTSAKGLTSSIWNNLKHMAATYLGVMGTRTAVETSDTITSAQNRLNHLNAQQVGSSAYGANGGYSPEVLNMTQETMDKMYASAQKVRMSYTDMISNVSKTMTLAGDAFQGNIDNAIRFQEIMAESYTLGGASAAEMSSSMYQLTQALGAGVLAGDELRSVREGAPLAYQKIEEFAQGVYNTTDSLKDLASQGKISSDMVVAAIMDMGDEADKAFAQTHILFSQAWTMIKNSAKKAFEPVSNMLRDMLNNAMDSGIIQKFEQAFTNIGKALIITLQVISNAFNWIAENWSWLKDILISGLLTLAIIMAAVAIEAAVAWVVANWQLILMAAAIFGIIYLLYQWQQGAMDTCTVILGIVAIIVAAIFIIGIAINSTWLIWVAVILAILALAFMFFEQICGGVMWLGATILNIGIGALNALMQAIYSTFVEPIAGIIEWFVNAFNGGFNGILGAAANAVGQIVSMFLGGLKTIAKAVDAIAGTSFADTITGWQDNAKSWGKNSNAVTYKVTAPEIARINATDAYNTGAAWGANIKGNINAWGSEQASLVNTDLKNKVNLDNIGKSLGLDLTGVTTPNSSGGSGTGGSYDPNAALNGIDNGVGKIGDDTGAIKDSMDLTEEDLKFLRDVANMEWKKEFTTATIQVDMSNYNTVNGDGDLDGIVTRLADKLYEELDMVANGVYAY